MAAPSAPAASDRDLASVAEARALARRAAAAQALLAELSQEQIDAIVDGMAAAVRPQAEALAALAVEETGFGVVADKVQKNLFSADRVHAFIRPMKTVGVIARFDDRKVIEIAEPFGVVAAVVPSTNPTSTAIYKILIALKARCAIVISPHPSATRCITRVAEIMASAARQAGAPEGAIGWMTTVTLEGTQELMKHRDVAVILATGGMGLVRAAYSAGKPAYGVGPGNAPCYVEASADIQKAAQDILTGKCFDHGVLCSSPNSVVVDAAVADEMERQFRGNGGYFLAPGEAEALARVLVTPQRLPNPALVGKPASFIAEKAGITVPPGTRALIARLTGVGREHPLSIEKLAPVLSYYVVQDWKEGCERCKQILRYGGMGHTMSIHSRDDRIILEFGLRKPAFRICVNTPTTHGSIGLTTGLDPAMTLGCGGFGGNITSDNITPRHLLNIKRLAYEIRPASTGRPAQAAASAAGAQSGRPRLPATAPPPAPAGISRQALADRIDRYLQSRGFVPGAAPAARLSSGRPTGPAATAAPAGSSPVTPPVVETPAVFLCEDDVRQAVKEGRTLLVSEKTIITPAARDLANAHNVLRYAGVRPLA